MDFLHTADWQIGMAARQAAGAGEKIREARLQTAQRIVAVAHEHKAQAILLAGDQFEDSQVGDDLVHRILKILADAAPVPVFVLPGNHDPLGPASIYQRRAFQHAPANMVIIREANPLVREDLGAVLLPFPITQKRATIDPTEHLPAFAGSGLIRIGLTHGSLRIEGKYQEDDHPIALDAARRQNLDYLALGHWHSYYSPDARCSYPGTPEPTGFDEPGSGTVNLVHIAGPGSVPVVERLPVARLNWHLWDEETAEPFDALLDDWRRRVEALQGTERCLLRLRLRGRLPAGLDVLLEDFADWARARLLYFDLDTTRLVPDLKAGRLQELAQAHPLLAGVLADLAALEHAGPGRNGSSEPAEVPPLDSADAGVIHEAAALLARLAGEVWP